MKLYKQSGTANVNVHYELEIRERIVRVEEELKHQQKLIIEGFNRLDKRFEQIMFEMNKRFEQQRNDIHQEIKPLMR